MVLRHCGEKGQIGNFPTTRGPNWNMFHEVTTEIVRASAMPALQNVKAMLHIVVLKS